MKDCDVCAGTGIPISGIPCICGGTGNALNAVIYLRGEILKLREGMRAATEYIDTGNTYARLVTERIAKETNTYWMVQD